MHQFKRIYLLSIVLISLIIPSITFTTYIESKPILETLNATAIVSNEMVSLPNKVSINYLPIILWSIYGLGLLIFGLKFSINLRQLLLKIKNNPKQKSAQFINVLLKDLVTPHTFFSYIFLNKYKYETQQIPEEVILHEQTHAAQMHSIDILLIELFQLVFWFNPLLYFIRKSIKLNHEFLADEAVLKNGVPANNYQHILLSFSSNQQGSPLANAINYSSIKKRITVMKTHTSKHNTWIRSLVLLPLLAILIYSFSSTEQLEKSLLSESIDSNFKARSIEIAVLDNGTYEVDGIKATKTTFGSVINQLHQDISPEIRNRIMNVHVNGNKEVSDQDVWFIYNSFIAYGFHRIVTYNQEIIREKGIKPFAITNSTTEASQDGASRELMREYTRLAKHYNSQTGNNYRVKLEDVERLKYIYGLMNKKQRKSAEPFPNFPEPPPAPDAAGAVLPPPPPPPIPDNATKAQKEKYNKVTEEYKRKYTVKNGMVSENTPPPPIPPNATPAQKAKYEEATKQYKLKTERIALKKEHVEKRSAEKNELARVREVQSKEELALRSEKVAYLEAEQALKTEKLRKAKEPLAPKPPKSPIDHVIDMAKKDATFYYDGKKVSSDKAIALLKKDSELSISTQNNGSSSPVVNITTNPVITDDDGKVITKIETIEQIKTNPKNDRNGYVTINGKTYFYSIKNSNVTYYNRWGKKVNEKGEVIN
ncbi:MAG: hypothetical protein KC469_00160 [Flavobacteriaceae bacterium]|nr:hypothetical protein [Flavobacteriaceae bacterium]